MVRKKLFSKKANTQKVVVFLLACTVLVVIISMFSSGGIFHQNSTKVEGLMDGMVSMLGNKQNIKDRQSGLSTQGLSSNSPTAKFLSLKEEITYIEQNKNDFDDFCIIPLRFSNQNRGEFLNKDMFLEFHKSTDGTVITLKQEKENDVISTSSDEFHTSLKIKYGFLESDESSNEKFGIIKDIKTPNQNIYLNYGANFNVDGRNELNDEKYGLLFPIVALASRSEENFFGITSDNMVYRARVTPDKSDLLTYLKYVGKMTSITAVAVSPYFFAAPVIAYFSFKDDNGDPFASDKPLLLLANKDELMFISFKGDKRNALSDSSRYHSSFNLLSYAQNQGVSYIDKNGDGITFCRPENYFYFNPAQSDGGKRKCKYAKNKKICESFVDTNNKKECEWVERTKYCKKKESTST